MKKIFPILGAAALAVSLSACGGAGEETDQGGGTAEEETPQDLQQAEGVVGGELDAALTAIRTAEAEIDGSAASEIDFDDDQGEWEVTVLTPEQSFEIRVQSDGSSVTGTGDPEEPESDDLTLVTEASVDFGTALKSAVGEVPGTIDEAQIEDDDSAVSWEVEIYPEGTTESVELRVDTESGEVTQTDG